MIEEHLFSETYKQAIQLGFHVHHQALSGVLLKKASHSSHVLFMYHFPTQVFSILFLNEKENSIFPLHIEIWVKTKQQLLW